MTQQQKERMNELYKKMDNWTITDDELKEYWKLESIQHSEYRAKNEPELKKYYDTYIAGKTWNEIDPSRWDFYSDIHKEVFGYRPKSISFNAEGR